MGKCMLCDGCGRTTTHHYFWEKEKTPLFLKKFTLKLGEGCHTEYNHFYTVNCAKTNKCHDNCRFKMICCYWEVKSLSKIIRPYEVIRPNELFTKRIELLPFVVARTILKFENSEYYDQIPGEFANKKAVEFSMSYIIKNKAINPPTPKLAQLLF